MQQSLHILLLEDDPLDVELVHSLLETEGFVCNIVQVESQNQFRDALAQHKFDIIFADYTLPSFNGLEALDIARDKCPNVPFIFVSGTLGEELAIESLKKGATDYVLKQRISRLAPSLRRALLEADERKQRRKVEEERERLIGELEAKNSELNSFTYTVSHDLKSPIITIRGFIDLLEKDLAENNSEGIERDFHYIRSAAENMQNLLDDLLKLSRIGRLVNPPKKVSMTELVQEVLDLLHGKTKERGVRVECSTTFPDVYGDRTRLREVWQNLIENAVKFMGEQSEPRVEIGWRTNGRQPVFYVRDNGIGIEPKFHPLVFDLFERLDQTTEGTGIGLALVKRIVDVHKGRIWLESSGKDKGTTFCFTILELNNGDVEK